MILGFFLELRYSVFNVQVRADTLKTEQSFFLQCASVTHSRLLVLPLSDCVSFLRKEVIQPQVLLRLPCYDFTPVICPALGG